ncbi:MAG: FHA domain-containing protein [Thermoanaerobaculia bacterium]
MRFRFGEFTLDDGQRRLLRGLATVHLSTKAFELLQLLVSRRPEAVPKRQIQDHLWPETFVSEGNLATLVSEIRKALGEGGHGPSHLRTVFGYGYAFDAEVREEAPATRVGSRRHFLVWDRQELDLTEGTTWIGREVDADVRVDHPSVSRRHARIEVAGDWATLEDLGSRNGTWRGDRRVEGRVALKDGDEFRVGTVSVVYRSESAGQATRTETAV